MPKLELLASGPGTGKTTYCIDLFRKEILKSPAGLDSRAYFVLPNREHAERIQNLLLKKEVPGLFNAHVLTIHELAARFLGGASRRPSDSLRHSVLRSILDTESSEGLLLEAFSSVRDLKGFQHVLTRCIKQVKAGLLSGAEFKKLSESSSKDAWFGARMRDLSKIIEYYDRRLSELGFQEAEDDIASLLASKPREQMELVVFDGFFAFTRAQEALVKWVSTHAAATVVTLTISGETRRPDVFEHSMKTRATLLAAGFNPINPPTQTSAVSPSLLHLEKDLFCQDASSKGPSGGVTILHARDAREEMVRIAREIRRLYRETELHWSDCCVIFRNIGVHQRLLESVFAEYGIDVHVHERQKLVETGYGIFAQRLIRLFVEDWQRDDLLHLAYSSYLKNISRKVDATGIEQAAAERALFQGRIEWESLATEKRLDEGSTELIALLSGIQDALDSASSVLQLSAHLRRFFSSADVNEKDDGAVKAFDDLLSTVSAGFGPGKVPVKEYLRRLLDSLESGLFSSRPSGHNRVQVYDAVMALPKEYKVVFIAGLADGSFPAAHIEDPILSDEDRGRVNQLVGREALELSRSRLSGEKYFFYMAATRSRSLLYLSCPALDADGRPILPSFFLDDVRLCFPEGSLEKPSLLGVKAWNEWETAKEARLAVIEAYFRRRPLSEAPEAELPSLLDLAISGPAYAHLVRWKEGAPAARLTATHPLQHRKSKGGFSPTSLERMHNCPFQYFAEKILELRDPLNFQMPRERGDVMHKAIEGFFGSLPPGGVLKTPVESLRSLLMKHLDEAFKKSEFVRQSPSRRIAALLEMRERMAWFLEEEISLAQRWSLVPTHFEKGFGFSRQKNGKPDHPFFMLSEDVPIGGFIDRIDLSRDGRAVLVDYKSSSTGFSKKLKNGREMQMPLYWMAVENLMKLKVAAILHRQLKPGEAVEGLYAANAKDLFPDRKKFVSEEEITALLTRTRSLVLENIRKLSEGDIEAKPIECGFCEMAAVCRFEKWKEVYTTR